ncbi:MAG TPA: terminase family protein, partial [Desulfatiglandales bacterium]|nr:terminase family protein [Desulfatiglandales bacterium]
KWAEESYGYQHPDGYKDEYKVLEAGFRNGSRIIGIPANPDTARGYTGNVYLDEFSVHKNSREMWAAVFPIVSRMGFRLITTFTPKGKQNKAYEIWNNPMFKKYKVDIYTAVAQGCPHNIEELKAAIDDPDLWAQEYELVFLDEATAFITYDMINEVETDRAGKPELREHGRVYVGMDIGRRRDLSIIWVLEEVGDVLWTRELVKMRKATFSEQDQELDRVMAEYNPVRVCMDQTGMGEKPVEDAKRRHGEYKVEGVLFTGPAKLDLATAVRRKFEDKLIRIPQEREVKEDLHSVKKITTSAGNIRFDAERSEDGHCYDADTEVLTLYGWKYFKNLAKNDKVAVLRDDILGYENPTDIYIQPYSGDMISIKNKQIDLLVTPNHRLYVKQDGSWQIIQATEVIKNKRIEFKKDAIWEGQDKGHIIIGSECIDINIWLEFMGYFISQGFVSTRSRSGIYAKNIEFSNIRKCIEKLPFKFWIEKNRTTEIGSYRSQNHDLFEYLAPQGKSYQRFMPRDFLDLPPQRLQILFDALMFGNGRRGASSWSYTTTSYQLASDLQELLLKIGMCGSISVRNMSLKGKNRRKIFEVNINRTRLTPQINKRRKSWSIIDYSGEIYCCTVPAGIIYVRRNGKCCWSGNSDRFWALALAIHAADAPHAMVTDTMPEFAEVRA